MEKTACSPEPNANSAGQRVCGYSFFQIYIYILHKWINKYMYILYMVHICIWDTIWPGRRDCFTKKRGCHSSWKTFFQPTNLRFFFYWLMSYVIVITVSPEQLQVQNTRISPGVWMALQLLVPPKSWFAGKIVHLVCFPQLATSNYFSFWHVWGHWKYLEKKPRISSRQELICLKPWNNNPTSTWFCVWDIFLPPAKDAEEITYWAAGNHL